jgi:mannose-6-phosphate isomerase-like protein (cupin superfamily)
MLLSRDEPHRLAVTRPIRCRIMGYAKKNLREVEDSALKHGLSSTQEARFPRADLSAEQTGLNYLIIKPSQREAFAHRHHEAEEVYVVLAGSGRVKLDDDLVELTELDALRVSPGTTRSLEAGPDGLALLIFGPHVEGDGEIVQDFWEA